MAYVVAITEGQETTAVLSVSPTLPPHVSGDLLMVWWSKNDGSGGTPTISGGSWTEAESTTAGGDNGLVGTTGNNSARGGYLWLVAASDAEAPPTITSTNANTWCWTAVVIKGAPATSPIDVARSAQTDTSEPYNATGVTTGTNDCLVFYSGSVDGGVSMTAFPGLMNMSNRDSGTDALCVAWKYQRTAGASGTKRFYATGTADDTVFFCVAVKDGSSGTLIDGYTDATIGTLITPNKGLTVLTNEINTPTSMVGYEVLPASGIRAADAVYQYDASPETYTTYTTAAGNSTTGDVVPFPATETTSDALLIGDDAQFFGLIVDRTSCTNGTAGALTWQYYATGGVWKTMSNVYDGTTGFTASLGIQTVGWSRSIASDWTQQTLTGESRYWIRAKVATVFTVNPTITRLYVGDQAAAYDAVAEVSDSGVNPFEGRLASSPGVTGCVLSGAFFRWAAATDLSSATYLLTSFIFGNPRDWIDSGQAVNGGVAFILGDTNGTIRVRGWTVGSLDSYARPAKWNVVGVAPSATSRFLDEASWDDTSVRSQLMAPSCQYGSTVAAWGHILSAGKFLLSGGGSSLPISYDKAVAISEGFPVIISDENIWHLPVKIGGGDAVNLDWSLFSMSFPTEYDTDNFARNWRVSNSTVGIGIEIDARSGDTCNLRLGTISGKSFWKFDVLATAEEATYDFTGLTLIGATVTLRAVHTWSGMTFINCPTFTTNAAVIQNCAFTNTKATCASPASADNISDCSFVSGGSGHAIEIGGTAADMILNGVTFTGYSGTSTNAPIYVNIATGTMTISITGGGSTPTIRTAGATVTVVNAKTVKVTVKDAATGAVVENARVYLIAAAGGDQVEGTVILSGLSSVSGVVQDTAFAYTNPQPVTGRVRRGTTTPLYQEALLSGSIGTAGYDQTVFMVRDE